MTETSKPRPADGAPSLAPRKQTRADATQQRILIAARKEFAKNGLGGARVDEIAARAKANKRMIYHYFVSKDALFQLVLEQAYLDLRQAEQKLELENLAPEAALEKLVRFTWQYYLKNPDFVTLVNSANLHKAKHLKNSANFRSVNKNYVGTTADILARGVASGAFRDNIDPIQLTISMAAVNFYYFTNRYTLSLIFDTDLMDEASLEARINFNIETIMRMVLK
jgi:AcrR family transcriptional regulator